MTQPSRPSSMKISPSGGGAPKGLRGLPAYQVRVLGGPPQLRRTSSLREGALPSHELSASLSQIEAPDPPASPMQGERHNPLSSPLQGEVPKAEGVPLRQPPPKGHADAPSVAPRQLPLRGRAKSWTDPSAEVRSNLRTRLRVLRSSRLFLALVILAVLAAILTACGSETSFDDPQNPVSQIAWPDFERLHYDMLDQTDTLLGTLTLESVRQDDVYQLSLQFLLDTEDGTVTDDVTVWVDAQSMQPIRYERYAESSEETLSAEADYQVNDDGEIVAHVRLDEDGEITEETVEAGVFAFDNDSSAWLWRTLAFEQDLELTYRSVNVLQRRSQLVQVAVRGQDTLRGPEGDVVVWQVVATPGVEVSRAWYEIDPPHRLIRWDQQPRRFVLTKIETEP